MSTEDATPAHDQAMNLQDATHVQAYLDHLTRIGHPRTTVDTYRYVLRGAARGLPCGLGRALGEEIEAWLAGYSRSTQITYGAALRGFYRYHQRNGNLVGDDPTADLPRVRRPRRRPRPVEHDQLARILQHARAPVWLWALIAAYEGARCVEIARLTRTDITEQVTYLHGKGDAERLVPTHPLVWEAVQTLPAGPVAGGRSPHSVSRAASVEFRRVGLVGVTMHRLRHWHGTWAQAAAGDPRVTQELLGHASLSTVQTYTAVSDRAMRAAVLGLPRVSASGDGPGGG